MDLPVLALDKVQQALENESSDSALLLKAYLSLQYWKSREPKSWQALRRQIHLPDFNRSQLSVDVWIDLLFLLYLDRPADRDALKFYGSGVAAGFLNFKDVHRLLQSASRSSTSLDPGPLWSRIKASLWSRMQKRKEARSSRTSQSDSRSQRTDSITPGNKGTEHSDHNLEDQDPGMGAPEISGHDAESQDPGIKAPEISGHDAESQDPNTKAPEFSEHEAVNQAPDRQASKILQKPCLAFVVPRFGTGFSGGIERLCLEAARLLASHYRLEIYTTCANDYITWANVWPAGTHIFQNPPATVRRFDTKPRELGRFVDAERKLKEALHSGKSADGESRQIAELTEQWLLAQGPISETLEKSLLESARSRGFEAAIFFAFQYSLAPRLIPSFRTLGIPVALVPAAHPDWTLDIPALQACLSDVDLWITSTPEEEALLANTLQRSNLKPPVCMPGGAPISVPGPARSDPGWPSRKDRPARENQKEARPPNSPSRATDSSMGDSRASGVVSTSDPELETTSTDDFGEEAPYENFALYVGRLDPSKGVDELIQFYLFYRMVAEEPLDLVLVGNPAMAIPEHPSIHVTGFVPDHGLNELYRRATVLINPSPYESLSIVLLEAWARGLPTLSNGNSAVLEAQTARSKCGLCYKDLNQFIAALETIRNSQSMAESGPDFIRENYDSESIFENYNEGIRYLIDSANKQ